MPSIVTRELDVMTANYISYRVVVADNFHYMDDSENYTPGSFISIEDVVAAAKTVVDEYPASAYEPGMNSSALNDSYRSFSNDRFFVGPEPRGTLFSASEYS